MQLTARHIAAIRKHVGLQYVSLAAGLGLAIAAAINAGALKSGAATTSSVSSAGSARAAVKPAIVYQQEPSAAVLYIVASQEQANQIAQAASEDERLSVEQGLPLPSVARAFFIAGRPGSGTAEQSTYNGELAQGDDMANFAIVDLRNSR